MSVQRIMLSAALALLVTGCATTGEPEFGSSVRHMIVGQTFDPDAGKRAPGQVSGLDGAKAGAAVKAYKADKAEGAGQQQPMEIFVNR